LAGNNVFPSGSTFSDLEFKMYSKAMRRGRRYVKFVLDNFRDNMLITCREGETENMTRARIYDEFTNEMHPDFQNFIRVIEGMHQTCQIDFIPDLFDDADEKVRYEEKFKLLLFQYYPLYSTFPTIHGGIQSSNVHVGALEGSLVLSHAEHVALTSRSLRKHTNLDDDVATVVLNYMFTNWYWIKN
jgi:hypothetical protein